MTLSIGTMAVTSMGGAAGRKRDTASSRGIVVSTLIVDHFPNGSTGFSPATRTNTHPPTTLCSYPKRDAAGLRLHPAKE
jgi:hypothetical protein